MEKYFVAPPTLCRWANDLVAKRGPLAPAIAGVPRFSLAFGERKAGHTMLSVHEGKFRSVV